MEYKRNRKESQSDFKLSNLEVCLCFVTHLQDLRKKIKEDKKKEDKQSKCRGGSGAGQRNTAASEGSFNCLDHRIE